MTEYAEDAYFVTRKRDLGGLQKALGDQVQVLARGNLGHRECVAFKLNETQRSIAGH
ncbi:MAG: hypothetical protein J7M40_15550 [Planctomycetes bacterium]|nr:hypothetical protein [Planctomycetota bacterium]